MPDSPLPVLRIYLAGLPEGDAARLQTFVRVRSDRLKRDWQIVAEAPIDLYVHDGNDLPTVPGQLDGPPALISVASAGDSNAGAETTLRRPLQYEDFVDRLAALEQRTGLISVATPVLVSAPATSPAPRSPRHLSGAQRVKLLRWPSPSVLRLHRYGLRMASFLSSRALSAGELSTLSGAAAEECTAFIDALDRAGLLVHDTVAARPIPNETAKDTPPRHLAHSGARPTRSLLANLRTRLGIRND